MVFSPNLVLHTHHYLSVYIPCTHVPLFSVLQLKKAFELKHYVLSELPIMLLKLNNPTTESYIKLNLLIIILPQNLLTGNSQEVSAVKFVSVNQIK